MGDNGDRDAGPNPLGYFSRINRFTSVRFPAGARRGRRDITAVGATSLLATQTSFKVT